MNQKGFTNIAIIVLVVVLAGVAAYFVLNETLLRPTPTITVSLGEEFTLKKGEVARVKDLDVYLRLKGFGYPPCPKGTECVAVFGVIYELIVNGKVYNGYGGYVSYSPPEAPYDVLIKKSDDRTYATFVIQKPEISCISKSGISRDSCWIELARRFKDPTYCDKIQNLRNKDLFNTDICFGRLAE